VAKKKKRPNKKHPRTRTPQLRLALVEAQALMRRGQWLEARDRLEGLERRHPRDPEVLLLLLSAYQQLRDHVRLRAVSERLAPLVPNSPDVPLAAAAADLANGFPARALRTYQSFLARWPDHPAAEQVRRTVAGLETDLGRMLEDVGLSGPDGLELAALHEEIQCLLAEGRYPETRAKAAELLRRKPRFAAALNNGGEASFREGRFAEAVAAAEHVLGFDPDNFHALSNLTRYLFLGGRLAEARAAAERLKAVRSENPDVWPKKAEALSFLGDDQGVLAAWEGARLAGEDNLPSHGALLVHLAAVAACRLGREDEGRRLWQTALRRQPSLDLARANLDDFERPPGQRHAPWPFTITYWLPAATVDDLRRRLEAPLRRDDAAFRTAARGFLEAHPELTALAPFMLDHGDGPTREFALRLASMAQTPELLAALRDFALGRRGTDEMRMQAGQAATEAGLIPTGPVRFWSNGEWTEVLLLGYEIYWEPKHQNHAPEVERWGIEAIEATNRGDGRRAEELLRKALEVEPDAPDLQNNLAAALQAQGRFEEGEALVRRLHARHPDYFFARAAVARMHALDADFDKAKELLAPLLTMRRLHITEFRALCSAQIDLLMEEGQRDGARTWLELWERADPDGPLLDHYRYRVEAPPWQRGRGKKPRRPAP
jgi:tetratricopeptide (TPR) repeat protein